MVVVEGISLEVGGGGGGGLGVYTGGGIGV